MFTNLETDIFNWLLSYAYEPMHVYMAVILLMYASSFGLPFPEEIVIVSAGIVAYLASHPHLYPAPYDGAVGVNLYILAFVAVMGVVTSDILIYGIGRLTGPQIMRSQWVHRIIGENTLHRVQRWMDRYGVWACAMFRFTPGVRFPGHLTCGITRMPFWKFLLVDGSAALLTVPTQILLIGLYGEHVLKYLREFKMGVIGIGLIVVGYFLIKWALKRQAINRSTIS